MQKYNKLICIMLLIPFFANSPAQNQPTTNIKLTKYIINKHAYLNIGEFISKHQLKSTYYESKEKLEIHYNTDQLLFSPNSSFCKINDTIYHLIHPTIYQNNELFVPAIQYYNILEKAEWPISIRKIDDNFIYSTINLYDIDSFQIIDKQNGILIQLNTNKIFIKENIATSYGSSGWLNLTILDSFIDTVKLKKEKLGPSVLKLGMIQTKESSQLSFLMKNKIDNIDINIEEKIINILLRVSSNTNTNKILEMRKKWIIDTIVLDAGHGGKDPGAIGINQLQEKTVALDITKKLGKMIENKLGLKVIYTRTADVFVPLWERTNIANKSEGKIFISIHANSNSQSERTSGFETYLLRPGKTKEAIAVAERENSVIELESQPNQYIKLNKENYILASITQNSFMKESEKLAELIQINLSKNINSRNRGIKQAGFHVLVGASMPNVLIEAGFLSNKKEAKQLAKAQYRKKIAEAIYASIKEFKNQYEAKKINQ